ncbi:TlyA family RNA methyltransferase [Limnobacter humi]|uniref:TlyA family RNA methyltransferase n=1 Tax=Limnobacter humi TaxID=1778671 RepID=A0ABT1WDM3_9BURK|nr:TlyA family RNA methyltransferase [Limnobacter humi]MCQ8894832.1 TlyA family RNA methyltransferase [Limnobacter humi]
MRADLALVKQGLCTSRAQAQSFIEQGLVQVQRGMALPHPVRKASQTIEATDTLVVAESDCRLYVSRGGLKLQGALAHLQMRIDGARCMDFGQSTGGFTDCLLQHGAHSVIGLDVGHGQLHERLRNDPRVLAVEGVNLKTVDVVPLLAQWQRSHADFLPIDVSVADVSFISLVKIMPTLAQFLPPGSQNIWLVKPQFELGPDHIGKQGLVKWKDGLLTELEQAIRQACHCHGFETKEFFPCPLKGGDGNQEYIVRALKTAH